MVQWAIMAEAERGCGVRVEIRDDAAGATRAAADHLAGLLVRRDVRTLMAAGGNSPLGLYAEIARRALPLGHLEVFSLDDYVGVPAGDPRTVANLVRRRVVEAWGIPAGQFHGLSSEEAEALSSLRSQHEALAAKGGIDVLILGLGRNGHLGYNEPGTPPDAEGRLHDLEPTSIEANRAWFGGDYAPRRGVTAGLKTLLAARHVLILAFGAAKAGPVAAMVEGPREARCPASWLQGHPDAVAFIDAEAAARLTRSR
jgi:glucosamine-6-phosphate deaminase